MWTLVDHGHGDIKEKSFFFDEYYYLNQLGNKAGERDEALAHWQAASVTNYHSS
jgi:hypothetical protein